jgi:CHAT domain-containing protein
LRRGLELAEMSDDWAVIARILNNWGNLYNARQDHVKALAAYQESAELALRSQDHALASVAETNAARALMRLKSYDRAAYAVDLALEETMKLPDSYVKAFNLINIGLAYQDLRSARPEKNVRLQQQIFKAFHGALAITENIGDQRTASYALGYLGAAFEADGQLEQALVYTRKAVFAAQQVGASESLYRWQWQNARILKASNRIEKSITAYRQAVTTLQTIRSEMSDCYAAPQVSFNTIARSVCFELVDLLLRRAGETPPTDPEYTSLLLESRQLTELLKVFELRDYFQDDCLDVTQTPMVTLDEVARTAVILYPILLENRLELLVSLPEGLKHFTVPVKANTLIREIRAFRKTLEKRTTREFLPHARQLYDWLIRPLEPYLSRANVETLVLVPDGPLRTIPPAALHDGHDYLIKKYAIAVTPGIELIDPQPLEMNNLKVLGLGLTESVQGFAPLPFVDIELAVIGELYDGNWLLDDEFRLSEMETALRKEQYGIVHFASHGQFGGDLEKTFLLTFDEKLTLDRLGQFVTLFRYRDKPLDLLTLSACETAAGDDRAALGLAGIAVRTGARSVLASLWFINDRASSQLVAEFYRQLKDPANSRASALRQAQIKTMTDPRFEHPGYWSPFILINNWL